MRITLFLIVWFGFSSYAMAQLSVAKRAIKQLEKGSEGKSLELINKAWEKDSLLPATLYVRAYYMLHIGDYKVYEPAYQFVQNGWARLDSLEDKEREKHVREQFGPEDFQTLKLRIDSLAFDHAQQVNSEEEYNAYIGKYPTARQVPMAKAKRNALAFAAALAQNTYQSYKTFMEWYPDAVQVPEAKNRYEKLYFDKSTADGKVTSYIRFLEQNPDTPYRKEAELRIFEVVTSEHSIGGYELFIKRYPQSYLRKKAERYAFHVAKEQGIPLDWVNTDSLRTVMALDGRGLIPFLEVDRFGFMDTTGQALIMPRFATISDAYKCAATYEDFLLVNNRLEGRNGARIVEKAYEEVVDLGYGLLKVNYNGRWGALHKTGDMILKEQYDEVRLFYGNILAAQTGKTWRLQTISGRLVIRDVFDDVFRQGDFLVFEKNEAFEVKTIAELLGAIDNDPIQFRFEYSDYELLDDGTLWLQAGRKEMIINEKGEQVIPLAEQEINSLSNAILISSSTGTQILDRNFKLQIKHLQLEGKNSSWAYGKVDSVHQIINLVDHRQFIIKPDSIKTPGRNFLIAYKGDSTTLFFNSGKRIAIPVATQHSIYVIGNQKSEYLVVAGKQQTVYDTAGHVKLETRFKDLNLLGEEYLIIEEQGKKGVLDLNTGEVGLKPVYQAIGNYSLGNISLLKDQKFGLYNSKRRILIAPKFEKNILPYTDSVFTVSNKGKQYLITHQGTYINEAGFDEIIHWNDTVAIVKESDGWRLFNLNSGKTEDYTFRSFKQAETPSGEKLAIILTEEGYGVLSSKSGLIIKPTFNDIIILPTKDSAIFLAEKHIKEVEFYVVVYYNNKGDIIRKQAFEPDEYFKIYCE